MRINVRGGTVRSSDPSLCLTCHATGRNSLMPRPRTCLGDGRDAVRDARRAPPLVADGEQPLIHRIRHDEPTALERVRPGVPPALATLVSRCLSKSAPARYPDAGALLARCGQSMRAPRCTHDSHGDIPA